MLMFISFPALVDERFELDSLASSSVSVDSLLGVLGFCGNPRCEMSLKIEGYDLFLVGNLIKLTKWRLG